MSKQPLGEVFGFPIDNTSQVANRHRELCLCPYHNHIDRCTKDKLEAPLGVCHVLHNGDSVITCPVRFREGWMIAQDAAEYFFPVDARWERLSEVRLHDAEGESAGNIDVVLVSYNEAGEILDFGALEVQAVYISGNVRNPFEHYMANRAARTSFDWSNERLYPRPDYLSSSRKRLAPQLVRKGGIFHAWGKRSAVALDRCFFATLPTLEEVSKEESEMAWFIYDLILDTGSNQYRLTRHRTVYTKFAEALQKIAVATPGDVESFRELIQAKLTQKLHPKPKKQRKST